MTRWYFVIGYEWDGRPDYPAIVIAYDEDDVENWAAERYDSYEIYPLREWIVDLTRNRMPPSAGGAVTTQSAQSMEAAVHA